MHQPEVGLLAFSVLLVGLPKKKERHQTTHTPSVPGKTACRMPKFILEVPTHRGIPLGLSKPKGYQAIAGSRAGGSSRARNASVFANPKSGACRRSLKTRRVCWALLVWRIDPGPLFIKTMTLPGRAKNNSHTQKKQKHGGLVMFGPLSLSRPSVFRRFCLPPSGPTAGVLRVGPREKLPGADPIDPIRSTRIGRGRRVDSFFLAPTRGKCDGHPSKGTPSQPLGRSFLFLSWCFFSFFWGGGGNKAKP